MIHDTHRASQNIMLAASDINTRVNMGPVSDEDWRTILRDLSNIRNLATSLETAIQNSGRVPPVSLGQGDFWQDIYGTPQTGVEVSFG